jgi:hypothetical protein
MTTEELENRFNYHAPTPLKAEAHDATRKIMLAVAQAVDILPDCREKSLAITKIEEAMFWANAAIARN